MLFLPLLFTKCFIAKEKPNGLTLQEATRRETVPFFEKTKGSAKQLLLSKKKGLLLVILWVFEKKTLGFLRKKKSKVF